MSIDISKYIGIPYKSKGYTLEGADCYGLVWLFLKTEMEIILPKFEAYDPYEDKQEVARQMNLNIPLLLGEETNLPEFGDIVLFKFGGISSHLGIYMGSNKVLHILRGTNSTCESYIRGRLKGRLDGIYRLKK